MLKSCSVSGKKPRRRREGCRAPLREAIAVLLLLLATAEARPDPPRCFEAEDPRFVLLSGDWQRVDADENQENVGGVQGSVPGAALRFDFTGSAVALRARRGPLTRRVTLRTRPTLFAWRTFPGPRLRVRIDGNREKILDLASGAGFAGAPLAENLEHGRHSLTVTLEAGTLFLDRFVVGDAPFAAVEAEVADETGMPVTDALVEFRNGRRLVAAVRAHRNGATGRICFLPPGTYAVSAAPDDDDGFGGGARIVDDPRLPSFQEKVALEAGKTARLAFRLAYRPGAAPPPAFVLRPAPGYPVIRRPGETLPLVLRDEGKEPERAFLLPEGGSPVALEVGRPLREPWARVFPVAIPGNLPAGPYGLSVEGAGWREHLDRVVFLRDAIGTRYRIAHVTDPHVRNFLTNWRRYNDLVAVAKEAGRRGASFAVITGDLTDNGVPSQFLRFRRALRAFPMPVFVCEGNHDHFQAGETRFYRGRDAYPRFMGLRWYPFRFGADRFAVLGTGAYELLAPAQEAWAKVFLSPGEPGLKALLYHYDYTGGLSGRRTTLPADQLAHLASRCRAGLILEGHLHKARVRRIATAVSYTGPAVKDGQFEMVSVEDGRATGVELVSVETGKGPPGIGPQAIEARPPGPPWSEAWKTVVEAGDPQDPGRLLGGSADWRVRHAAASVIGLRGVAGETRPALEKALSDGNVFVREEAVRALASDTRVTPLKRAVEDVDPRVRIAAVRAMGRVRGGASVEALAGVLADESPRVSRVAARVLSGFGTGGIVEVLGEGLAREGVSRGARIVLVKALAGHGREASSEHLAAVLSDADLVVRGEAALALGSWKDRRAVPELIRLVEEGKRSRQDRAHRLLVRLSGEDFGVGTPAAREAWEAWWEEQR